MRRPLAAALFIALSAGCAPAPSPDEPTTATSAPASVASAGLTRGRLLPASAPTRVEIPSLGVTVDGVIPLGRQADGAMAVPADARTIGWYTGAPSPGELGPAILAGHVDLKGRPGTFARLSTLERGDRIVVTREDGRAATFAVTRVDRYAKDEFPSDDVYGAVDHAGLRMITCGGRFDRGSGHYVDNVVAYAEMIS